MSDQHCPKSSSCLLQALWGKNDLGNIQISAGWCSWNWLCMTLPKEKHIPKFSTTSHGMFHGGLCWCKQSFAWLVVLGAHTQKHQLTKALPWSGLQSHSSPDLFADNLVCGNFVAKGDATFVHVKCLNAFFILAAATWESFLCFKMIFLVGSWIFVRHNVLFGFHSVGSIVFAAGPGLKVSHEPPSHECDSAQVGGHAVPAIPWGNQHAALCNVMPTDIAFWHDVWLVMTFDFTDLVRLSFVHLPTWLFAATDKGMITPILFQTPDAWSVSFHGFREWHNRICPSWVQKPGHNHFPLSVIGHMKCFWHDETLTVFDFSHLFVQLTMFLLIVCIHVCLGAFLSLVKSVDGMISLSTAPQFWILFASHEFLHFVIHPATSAKKQSGQSQKQTGNACSVWANRLNISADCWN